MRTVTNSIMLYNAMYLNTENDVVKAALPSLKISRSYRLTKSNKSDKMKMNLLNQCRNTSDIRNLQNKGRIKYFNQILPCISGVSRQQSHETTSYAATVAVNRSNTPMLKYLCLKKLKFCLIYIYIYIV
jgi:hypothetical protein